MIVASWQITACAKAADLTTMVKKVISEHCAEGDPRNFRESLTIVCSIDDYRRIKKKARDEAKHLDRFDFEENSSHFMLDLVELVD